MAKAAEFDLKYKNNLGVLVSQLVAKRLESRLHNADIYDYDDALTAGKTVDVAALERAMAKTTNK